MTHLWKGIVADLGFWTAAGLLAALFSVPLGDVTGVEPLWLAAGAAGLVATAVVLFVGLNRLRPVPRQLVWSFAVANFASAPALWLTALLGWLPVTAVGNWALAACADAMFLLGLYQLYLLRQRA
jgi:bacteriorhodopsin